MALFGKNLASSICTIITFADFAEPPALATVKEANFHQETTYTFNNSAIFAENEGFFSNKLSIMFWEMGYRCLERFFKHMNNLKTGSLCQTKEVLEKREQLNFVIDDISTQLTVCSSKLSKLTQNLDIFQNCKSAIEDYQNCDFTVKETKKRFLTLPPGIYMLNCINCNVTCHENCDLPDDGQKQMCLAMDKEGKCRICPKKCAWLHHKSTQYVFEHVTGNVTKTYVEMKTRYDETKIKVFIYEKFTKELINEVDSIFNAIKSSMNEINRCKTRLKEIALRPEPVFSIDDIDLMIQSEQEKKEPGFFKRVIMLKKLRRMALVGKDKEILVNDIQKAMENIRTITDIIFERDY